MKKLKLTEEFLDNQISLYIDLKSSSINILQDMRQWHQNVTKATEWRKKSDQKNYFTVALPRAKKGISKFKSYGWYFV